MKRRKIDPEIKMAMVLEGLKGESPALLLKGKNADHRAARGRHN